MRDRDLARLEREDAEASSPTLNLVATYRRKLLALILIGGTVAVDGRAGDCDAGIQQGGDHGLTEGLLLVGWPPSPAQSSASAFIVSRVIRA